MVKKMGKNLHHQGSHLTLDNHSSGCVWGTLLHHFHHRRWPNVKKRLPQRRHSHGKDSTDRESTRAASDAAKMPENIDSAVETKRMQPGAAPKSSMKSRIKALITAEMPRRKGHHHRSSSCPVKTDSTIPIPHPESPDTELTVESSYDELLGCHIRVHSVALLDPLLPTVGEESCELCATMLDVNYLKQGEVDRLGRQPVRDHTLIHDKSVYAIEQSTRASLQESKLFMDALDLLNMRKEVFLRILHDPSSSLAHQLHCRQKPDLRFGLTKSMSFPVSASSARSATKQEKGSSGDGSRNSAEVIENGSPKQPLRELELSDKAPPTSANLLRKMHDSKVALNRFKNLREKLKTVIRDRKEEKKRIFMDAVHHKVPYGQRVSKDSHDSSHMTAEFKSDKFIQGPDFGKNPLQRFKRTSSYNELLDRCNPILDANSNGEAKELVSGSIRSRTATLGRILSLPNLRSYASIQIDNSASGSSMNAPDARAAAGNLSVGSIDPNERKLSRVASESTMQPCLVSESGSQEIFLDIGETFDDSADSKTWESAPIHDFSLEPVLSSAPQSAKPYRVSDNDFNYQEDSSAIQLENRMDNDIMESKVKKLHEDILQIQVDAKNEAEFNYVKDVLELSGFSRNEILGRWHSAEQPVNPMVFEEMEGYWVHEPECRANEEGGSCDHLLLFDLINEVLLGIYKKSFCYWPTLLTSQSCMHQMPKGRRVLEEVWAEISRLLHWRPEADQAIDDAVSKDLAEGDKWMNLQFDAECVGLEVEDLIFDDLLEEIISTRIPQVHF